MRAPPTLKLMPCNADGFKKCIGLPPNFHPHIGVASSNASVASSMTVSTLDDSQTDCFGWGKSGVAGEERLRGLTELWWGESKRWAVGGWNEARRNSSVETLDDKSIYSFNDNSGPFVQTWRLHRGQMGVVGRMLYVRPSTVSRTSVMSDKAAQQTFMLRGLFVAKGTSNTFRQQRSPLWDLEPFKSMPNRGDGMSMFRLRSMYRGPSRCWQAVQWFDLRKRWNKGLLGCSQVNQRFDSRKRVRPLWRIPNKVAMYVFIK
jgi:hypothetical protein